MAARTCSAGIRRRRATVVTTCSVTESASRCVASRWASLICSRSSWSAALLYSCRCPICGSIPSRSSAARRNTARVATPTSPSIPEGWTHTWSKCTARWYGSVPAPSSPKDSVQHAVGLPLAANASTPEPSSSTCAGVSRSRPAWATRPTTVGSSAASRSRERTVDSVGTCRARSAASGSCGGDLQQATGEVELEQQGGGAHSSTLAGRRRSERRRSGLVGAAGRPARRPGDARPAGCAGRRRPDRAATEGSTAAERWPPRPCRAPRSPRSPQTRPGWISLLGAGLRGWAVEGSIPRDGGRQHGPFDPAPSVGAHAGGRDLHAVMCRSDLASSRKEPAWKSLLSPGGSPSA